jgi:hypothetical protein
MLYWEIVGHSVVSRIPTSFIRSGLLTSRRPPVCTRGCFTELIACIYILPNSLNFGGQTGTIFGYVFECDSYVGHRL